MKKLGSQIVKNFKGNYQEVEKGILNPSKLDNSKYDIFSTAQITEYLGNVIKKNEGMALEIQKSVVANVKSELSHLIPVNIKHNGTVKKFYVCKAGVCTELSKALEPVNKKEGYFEEKSINEDDVLKFIDENEEVDDDALIKEFGEEVTEVLNSLEEDGKLDVDEDGFYFVTDEVEEKPEEEEEEKEEEEEEKKKPEKEEEKEEKPGEEEEEEKIEEEEEKKPEEEEEKKPEEEEEEKKEEEIDNNGGGTQSLEEKLEEEEKKPEEEEEKIEEEEEEQKPGEEEEEKIEEEEEKKPEEEEEEEKNRGRRNAGRRKRKV